MEESQRTPETLSSNNALPPVESPDAGFIVRLFVVPAVIVAIIVLVWIGINSLAHRGADPSRYVEELQRNSEARWQSAHNLAEELRNPGNDKLKQDRKIARSLVAVLQSELDQGSVANEALNLRVYLCHALGQFHLGDVVPALARAAVTERAPEELPVRVAALRDLAIFMDHSPELARQAHDLPIQGAGGLLELFLEQSRGKDPLVRSVAAIGLGQLGSSAAIERLTRMLTDAYPNVRFNAATRLALHGKAACVGVLKEMLDPQATAAIEVESEVEYRDHKRLSVLDAGLRAVEELHARNSKANLAPLAKALRKLASAKIPLAQTNAVADIQARAKVLAANLGRRGSQQTN